MAYTNFVQVNGKVVDVFGYRVMSKGEEFERFEFMVKVRVNSEDVEGDFDVKFSAKKTGKSASGFLTLYDQLRTITENGEDDADRVTINCRVVQNAYYSKGVLTDKPELLAITCNREKDSKKFDDNASYSVLGYIEEMNDLEDGTLEIRALVNEYAFQQGIRGHELSFYVNNKDEVADYKELLEIGKVHSLEGFVVSRKVKIHIAEEDLVELEVKGVGTAKKRIIEENERRKKLREEGLFKDEIRLELSGAYPSLTEEEIEQEEYPFFDVDVEDMKDGINDRLEKSRDRDIKRNPNYYKGVDDDDCPF